LLAVAGALAPGLRPADAQDPKVEAAKKEGKVVWYISMFDVDTAEQVAKAFEQRYPGVKVEVVRATAGVVYQRVLQESQAGVFAADVFSSTEEGHYAAFKDKGLIQPYQPVDWDKVISRFQKIDPQNFYQVASVGVSLIAYNTQKVGANEAPRKWKDLLDPKWKGKVGISHPAFSGYVATWVVAMTNLYGWDYFEALAKQSPQIGRSLNDTVTMLSSGERLVALSSDLFASKMKNKGNPLELVYPEDGAVLMTAPSAVLAKAPHPNAAKLFMDFFMTKEYSEVLVRNGALPLRPDVAPPKGLKPITGVKVIRPTLEELRTGVPQVIEKFRATFGV
jgi:iron(III) transport system substrate-binding protein